MRQMKKADQEARALLPEKLYPRFEYSSPNRCGRVAAAGMGSRAMAGNAREPARTVTNKVVAVLTAFGRTDGPLSLAEVRRATGLPAAPPLLPGASAGKRWRFRRNLVIYVAHRGGLSQRFLADVFDLPRSRIAEIIREFRGHADP